MSYELMHFRDAEKILKKKQMLKDVTTTMEYINEVLAGALYKRELLRLAMVEMGWICPMRKIRSGKPSMGASIDIRALKRISASTVHSGRMNTSWKVFCGCRWVMTAKKSMRAF